MADILWTAALVGIFRFFSFFVQCCNPFIKVSIIESECSWTSAVCLQLNPVCTVVNTSFNILTSSLDKPSLFNTSYYKREKQSTVQVMLLAQINRLKLC